MTDVWAAKSGFRANYTDTEWDEKFEFAGGKFSWRKFISRGGVNEPEIFVIKQQPGLVNNRHMHSEGEVQYIIEGSILMDGKEWGQGSFFYNPKQVVYGPLIAGPNGVTYLNIRAVPADVADRSKAPVSPGANRHVQRTELKKKVVKKALATK